MFLNLILGGALVMASAIVALFFLRYWKNTHDIFFVYFTAAFALEALSWILFLFHQQQVNDPATYLIRLAAYLLILIAIIGKNRGSSKRKRGEASDHSRVGPGS